MQTTLHKFLQVQSSDESSSSSDYSSSDEERKRSMLSDWTRVKGRDQFTAKVTRVWEIGGDLKALFKEKCTVMTPEAIKELVLFDPDSYRDRGQDLKSEAHKLTEEQLLDYAKMASRIRARIYRDASML